MSRYDAWCFTLLYVIGYGIMIAYLWRYKGGQIDRHVERVTYRRGGSTENPHNAVYRSEILAQWNHSSNQVGRWHMAGESVGCRRLSRKADVQTRGQITLSVAGYALTACKTIGAYPCIATSLSILHGLWLYVKAMRLGRAYLHVVPLSGDVS